MTIDEIHCPVDPLDVLCAGGIHSGIIHRTERECPGDRSAFYLRMPRSGRSVLELTIIDDPGTTMFADVLKTTPALLDLPSLCVLVAVPMLVALQEPL